MDDLTAEVSVEVSVDAADDMTEAFLRGYTSAYNLFADDEDGELCDDCGCAASDEYVVTEQVEVPTTQGFADIVRAHAEDFSKIDVDDRIHTIEVCPERTTITYEQG